MITPNHELADTYIKLTLIFAIGTGKIVRPLLLAMCRGCGIKDNGKQVRA